MFIDLNCDMGESFGAYTIGDDVQMLTIPLELATL